MTDLDVVLAGAWTRLHQSAEVRDAGFRMAQLATVGSKGAPKVRTIVLRGASSSDRLVRFHTDSRSPKVAEMTANAAVSLVAYHRDAGEQIRIHFFKLACGGFRGVQNRKINPQGVMVTAYPIL